MSFSDVKTMTDFLDQRQCNYRWM